MTRPQIAPYGSWKSPIRAADIAEATIGLGSVQLAPDGSVYWLEARPAEGGRYVVVRLDPGGRRRDMTPPGFSARSRVNEYGGGAYTVCRDAVFFTNDADQRIYSYDGRAAPRALTPRDQPLRFADYTCDQRNNRLICVREDHARGVEPAQTIVAVWMDACEDDPGHVLVAGQDFYAAPRLSPDGTRLAWLAWNHPNMPWDASDIRMAPIEEGGRPGRAIHIAGGDAESVAQPEWSPDGTLHFVSDRGGWWNICRWNDGRVEPLTHEQAEFAAPPWQLGGSLYAFAGPGRIVCARTQNGTWKLARLDPRTRRMDAIALPFTTISEVRANPTGAVLVAASPWLAPRLVRISLADETIEILRSSTELKFDDGYISGPETVEFPTTGELTAHGLFCRPKNRDFTGSVRELPPLLVRAHGGPTDAASPSLRLGLQYCTSRGLAVLDVNYGGSTGYGRPYRDRLAGQWGVVDVDDCCNGARWLAEKGLVDGKRMVISGGSAGGFTVLAALAFRDVFAAGASHFGISDLDLMARESHKFEGHYHDRLIGPYPACRELYLERSPINHLDRLKRPVIFFQGLEDKVVLPNQSERMFAALKQGGVPTAYLAFAGEGHGFRKAENIRRALEAELYFFSRVLGFGLADPPAPVPIENL